MPKPKPIEVKAKSKGGRPHKNPPKFHDGSEAAKRFAAGLSFAIAGGPQPPEKPA